MSPFPLIVQMRGSVQILYKHCPNVFFNHQDLMRFKSTGQSESKLMPTLTPLLEPLRCVSASGTSCTCLCPGERRCECEQRPVSTGEAQPSLRPPRYANNFQPQCPGEGATTRRWAAQARDAEGGSWHCGPLPGPLLLSGKVCHQGETYFIMWSLRRTSSAKWKVWPALLSLGAGAVQVLCPLLVSPSCGGEEPRERPRWANEKCPTIHSVDAMDSPESVSLCP